MRESGILSQKTIQWAAFLVGLIALLGLLSQDNCAATGETCMNLLQAGLTGVLVGGIYALVALGIVIINKASGVFNFAHGMMMLFGGLMFWQTFQGVPSTNLSLVLAALTVIIFLSFLTAGAEQTPPSAKESRVQRWQRTLTAPVFLMALGAGIIAGIIAYALLQQTDYDNIYKIIAALALLGGIGLLARLLRSEDAARKVDESASQRNLRLMQTTAFILAVMLVGLAVLFFFADIPDNIFRGALGSLIVSIALGLAVERFTIRPLLGQPLLAAILMTLAISLLLQGFISLIWGANPRPLSVFVEPPQVMVVQVGTDPETGEPIFQEMSSGTVAGKALPNYRINPGGIFSRDLSFARNLVWGFGIALTCFVGFVVFFQFTGTGLAMRAVAENQVLAESVGLKVRTILAVAWAIATTMAMVAAVIQGTGAGVGLGVLVIPPLALRAFPAVLLGGLESITGALVGGLIIGVVQELASATFGSTTGQEFAPFAVLLIVLIIRPDGLFGQRRIDRV